MNHPTTTPTQHRFDVLIVGSGLAGLSAALHLAPTHRVAVITKRQVEDREEAYVLRIAQAVKDAVAMGAAS